MNRLALSQRLMQAQASYYDALIIINETLRNNSTNLGLMVPGFPEQLAVPNGVGVTADGRPLFRAIVRRRREAFRSPRDFGNAVQDALDETCYSHYLNRLVLLRVDPLPGGYILTLTFGG